MITFVHVKGPDCDDIAMELSSLHGHDAQAKLNIHCHFDYSHLSR
jgi:hypothetical protein